VDLYVREAPLRPAIGARARAWAAAEAPEIVRGDRKFYRPAGSIAGAGGGASEALGAAQPRHGRVSRGNLGVLVVDYALVASARGAAEVNET
jgi:hypothetical protein